MKQNLLLITASLRFLLVLFIAATGLLITAGCATHKPIYEYRLFSTVEGVNEHASEGWEVVNFTTKRDGSHEYLVRRPRKASLEDAR